MAIRDIRCSVLTRRRWAGNLCIGVGISLFDVSDSFGASEFWNRKDPSSWTSDEVLQLATRSPWAKSARVLPRPRRDRGSFQPNAPEIGGGRSGGRGTGPEPVVPVTEATVVWESAQPLLDALKSRFSSDFANHYVIGVSDLPDPQRKRQPGQGSIAARLQARGKEPVDAGAVEQLRNLLLLGFSKELLPLTATDRDVLFTLETDQFTVRARFDPKEMNYKGILAV